MELFMPMRPEVAARKLDTRDMVLAGIPTRFWTATLAQIPDSAPHKEVLARWCSAPAEPVNMGRGLLLHGETGQGKTACACIFGKAVKAHGGAVWFSQAETIMSSIMEDWNHPDEGYLEKDYWQHRANVWIIDDIANALGSDQTRAVIEREIRRRLSQQRAIVVTTNDLRLPSLGEQTQRMLRENLIAVEVKGTTFKSDKVRETSDWHKDFQARGRK